MLQSLFELKKDYTEESKWKITRILSFLYIAGFIVGIIVVANQNKETNQVNDLINRISFNVTKIDSLSNEQLRIIRKSINQTRLIINRSDSISKELIKVFEINESLITQYDRINAKLSKQVELETKQFKERAPSIGLMDYDINLEGNDSTAYSINVCIRNYGKRTALIHGGNGYIVCFDKKNQPLGYIEIRGNNEKGLLAPDEINHMRLCYSSFGIRDLRYLKTESDFAVICLKVHYEDIAMNKDSIEYLYSGWIPRMETFGGLKDWQYSIAKKWAIKNLNFGEKEY